MSSRMVVKDYIPYVSVDQEKKKMKSSHVNKILNAIHDECSTSEGESLMIIDGESGDELEGSIRQRRTIG